MRHYVFAALVVALLGATRAQADRIRTQSGIGYDGKIVDMDAGGLVLEYAGGKRTVPLADIASIRADQYPDLEKAEETYARGLAGGPKAVQDFAEAERLYEGLGRRGPPPWLRVLVDSRMYKLYVESGRVQEALDAYLALAENQPTLVAGLKLPRPRPDDTAGNRKMLTKVEAALKNAGDKPYAAELKQLRLQLVALDKAASPVAQASGTKDAEAEKQPDETVRLRMENEALRTMVKRLLEENNELKVEVQRLAKIVERAGLDAGKPQALEPVHPADGAPMAPGDGNAIVIQALREYQERINDIWKDQTRTDIQKEGQWYEATIRLDKVLRANRLVITCEVRDVRFDPARQTATLSLSPWRFIQTAGADFRDLLRIDLGELHIVASSAEEAAKIAKESTVTIEGILAISNDLSVPAGKQPSYLPNEQLRGQLQMGHIVGCEPYLLLSFKDGFVLKLDGVRQTLRD